MSVKNDMLELPLEVRRNIARSARKLLSDEPTIDTIIMERKRDVVKGEKASDFELFVFFSAESETERERIISESVYYEGSGEISENYRISDPGKNYLKSDSSPSENEAEALLYKSVHMYRENEKAYLEFLQEHQKCFSKKNFLDITTINSPEMEKSNPLYYKLYMTHSFEKGYVIYNRLMKPFITMHNLSDLNQNL